MWELNPHLLRETGVFPKNEYSLFLTTLKVSRVPIKSQKSQDSTLDSGYLPHHLEPIYHVGEHITQIIC